MHKGLAALALWGAFACWWWNEPLSHMRSCINNRSWSTPCSLQDIVGKDAVSKAKAHAATVPPPAPRQAGPLPYHVDGVLFLFTSDRARRTYFQSLDCIMYNLPFEPDPLLRRKRMEKIQAYSFHPLFGIPDAEHAGEYEVMDEQRAAAILHYLQDTVDQTYK